MVNMEHFPHFKAYGALPSKLTYSTVAPYVTHVPKINCILLNGHDRSLINPS